jgi:hypothetical protein
MSARAAVDPRQSDLIDLSVRLVSPLIILWIRPFGVHASGFWPNLILALLVSFLAAGGLWFYAERRFMPFRGLMTSDPPARSGLILGGAAGLVTLFVLARVLSVPASGQRLQWDDSMLGMAIVLIASIYVAAGVAIWTGDRHPIAGAEETSPERPRSAALVDLIRRHADMEALAWLAQEPDESVLTIVNALSHSSDSDVRKWIVSNASGRLGDRVAPMLERVASTDERPDVADRALDRLVEVAPERGKAFWPAVRARLSSENQVDVELAAWKLLAMRDPLLGDELDAVLTVWPDTEYIHQSFLVLQWCLDGDKDEILARIRVQDLALLPWLIRAAFYLDDEQVWDAIAHVAEHGTDHRAKRYASRALRERYASALPDLGD